MAANDETLTLCCLLWARAGLAADLSAYEDRVLALVGEHGGRVLQRAIGPATDEHPNEVQLFVFGSRADLNGYLDDPRRQALAPERDRVVARTEVFPVSWRAPSP